MTNDNKMKSTKPGFMTDLMVVGYRNINTPLVLAKMGDKQ
jgi:hypothetical protein